METTIRSLKALAEETRLRIVILLTTGELCVCDLKEALLLPQSTVSRHLCLLKSAGIISVRKAGVWTYYRLATPCPSLPSGMPEGLAVHLVNSGRVQEDLARLRAFKASKERKCS